MKQQHRAALAHQLTEFFHQELDRRYSRDNLERVSLLQEEGLLDSVPEEQIEHIKEFFKRVMYPLGEEREARDRGVETVERILGSTASLFSLVPKLPTIILRHGGQLPAIASAGLTVVSAYRLGRRMEEKVLDAVEELCEEEENRCDDQEKAPYELLRRAYGRLSEEETDKVLKRTEKVVRLGMNRKLMEATIEIVEIVRESRQDPEEQDALGYVSSVLREVRGLAEEYSPEQVDRILRLSEITEADYFDTLRAEA